MIEEIGVKVSELHLHPDIIDKAGKVSRSVHAYITILAKFGVSSMIYKDYELFNQFCLVNNININSSRKNGLMWLDSFKEKHLINY